MKWTLPLLIILSACATDTSQKVDDERLPVEIDHSNEISFSVDTTIEGTHIQYRLEPVPNYYVIKSITTDSTVEAHIYKDQRIVVKIDQDSIVITKDTLLKDINAEYLNNAIIQNLQPLLLDPAGGQYLFEYGPQKPFENFSYRHELSYSEGKWHNYIADK